MDIQNDLAELKEQIRFDEDRGLLTKEQADKALEVFK